MKKASLFTFVFVFLLVGNCFAQRSTNEGILRERYPDGALKYEYAVKDGERNGFYERYDEEGILEYREYYIEGVYDGTDPQHYLYRLVTWFHHISGDAEEVTPDEEDTLALLRQYAPADTPFDGNRMGIIRTVVPVDGTKEDRYPIILDAVSRDYVYLIEFKERKNEAFMEHHYYDLVRRYRLLRTAAIDVMFNADLIVDVFSRRHTGVEHGTSYARWRKKKGSRLWSVTQYMGEPDYIYSMKPAGWFEAYYGHANLRIVVHNSAVYFMEEGRPEWAGEKKYRNKNKKKM